MGTIGFLHTSPVHVATFDALVAEHAAGTATVHAVDEALLELARTAGPDAAADGVRRRVSELRAAGAQVVVCTCSTIGDVAERPVPDRSAGFATFRVDRPMARAAVAAGHRIGVVAALESTLAPTEALLRAEAAATGRSPVIELTLAAGAWERFEAGDVDGYLDLVADAARDLGERVDVIVLAQASMTGAGRLLGDVGVPVLSSPATAVRHAVELLTPGS